MRLEQAITYAGDDALVQVTPRSGPAFGSARDPLIEADAFGLGTRSAARRCDVGLAPNWINALTPDRGLTFAGGRL